MAFELGGVFYNAYLPEIVTREKIGRISGYGWGFGYLGCGAAGDRGLLFPELTNSASENCSSTYSDISKNALGVSTSKMCELSMTNSTEIPFYSIIKFVYQVIFNNNEN